MANQEQLGLLKQGVEVWNRWRIENSELKLDFGGVDLSSAKLTGMNLCNINFSFTNLQGADLQSALFNYANLRGANLHRADLRGASLGYAVLTNVDLSGALLTGANLLGASLDNSNLSQAELGSANLIRAKFSNSNLVEAKLIHADLSGANFSNTNLTHATLREAQALNTNFYAAVLTGVCIQNWNINVETNLTESVCEYVYLKEEWNKEQEKVVYLERRPSSGSFKPGGFTTLFQKALETVDLIFADGIDWNAFFQSFQDLRSQYSDESFSIQAIEKKSGGAFVIRLEVSAGADKVAIESGLKERYEMQLQFREERYRVELQAKDREIEIYKQKSADMMEIVILQAGRPISVEAKAVVDQSKSETFQNDYRGANIANNANKITGNAQQTASQFSQNSSQNLDDIIKLINSLRETAQAFPEGQREETLGHLGDLEDDLKQPTNDRTPRNIKATLAMLFAIGCTIAGTVDFTNNVLEIHNKLGIPLPQTQLTQQVPPSQPPRP